MVEVGDKALDFTLPSTVGEKVALSELIGKDNVVLAFYVLDWTPVCTNEMCGFQSGLGELEKLSAKVLGISVDSVFSHKEFAQKYGIKFPLLSDFNKEVSRKYGVLHEEIFGLKGVSKRSIFVVDKKGIIRYRWVTEDPKVAPNLEEIKKVLKDLK